VVASERADGLTIPQQIARQPAVSPERSLKRNRLARDRGRPPVCVPTGESSLA
jgi:hypothetical protein